MDRTTTQDGLPVVTPTTGLDREVLAALITDRLVVVGSDREVLTREAYRVTALPGRESDEACWVRLLVAPAHPSAADRAIAEAADDDVIPGARVVTAALHEDLRAVYLRAADGGQPEAYVELATAAEEA